MNSIEKGFEIKVVALEHFAVELCSNLFDLASNADMVAFNTLRGAQLDLKENLQSTSGIQLFVEVSLGLGTFTADTLRSSIRGVPMWAEWLRSDRVSWSQLPKETRVAFNIYAIRPEKSKSKAVLLGWGQFLLFDRLGFLKTGKQKLRLWLGTSVPPPKLTTGFVPENPDINALALHFEFESAPSGFAVAHDEPTDRGAASGRTRALQHVKPEKPVAEKIERLCLYDPMQQLSPEEKTMVWQNRFWVQSTAIPNSLVRLCEATNFFDNSAVRDLHQLVSTWGTLAPGEALELLGPNSADSRVRRFAVRCLRSLSDEDLCLYVLQLAHVLEFEAWHDSDLARFLVRLGFKKCFSRTHFLSFQCSWSEH